MNPNKNWNWFLFISALNIFRYLFWHINVQVQTVFSLKILVISRSSFLLNVIYYKSGQILIPFLSNLIRSKFLFNQPKYDPVFKKNSFFPMKTYIVGVNPRCGLLSIAFQPLCSCVIPITRFGFKRQGFLHWCSES